jgi:hypothetical protein
VAAPNEQPRWQRRKDVVQNFPIGLTFLWQLSKQHPDLCKKLSRRLVLIDTWKLASLFETAPSTHTLIPGKEG